MLKEGAGEGEAVAYHLCGMPTRVGWHGSCAAMAAAKNRCPSHHTFLPFATYKRIEKTKGGCPGVLKDDYYRAVLVTLQTPL
jgi:hypothetical protein